MKLVRGYLISLFDPDFIPTGLRTACIVGTLLFFINHGWAFLQKDMTRDRWISAILTYAMPYLVNVYGQYSYRRKVNS